MVYKEDPDKYLNPSSGFMIMGTVAGLFLMFLLLFVISTDGYDIVPVIIFVPGIIIVLSISFYRDVYNRPKFIKINENGLLLIFRFKKEELVTWTQIKATAHKKVTGISSKDKYGKGGALFLDRHITPVLVRSRIVIMIREKYYEKNGYFPNKAPDSD